MCDELARQSSRVRFRGLLTPEDCLSFGRSCDVLVNPRPATHGNENNFSSKLFDYALSGRSILTSKLSGVEDVLGHDAYYFDPYDFEPSLRRNLFALAKTSRAELDRRGMAIQQRVISEFSWTKQGARLARFLTELCTGGSATPVQEALAA
jgi:glycosyltransferase involved in cell wall biosynthesis